MKKTRVVHVPRERDDELLGWLTDRLAGVPQIEIASRAGRSQQAVSQAVRNVAAADIEESGEPEWIVAQAYP